MRGWRLRAAKYSAAARWYGNGGGAELGFARPRVAERSPAIPSVGGLAGLVGALFRGDWSARDWGGSFSDAGLLS